MNESKLDAVKKEIRSVLISSKSGLSLKEFSNEYKSLLGKTLPYKEFGYHTYVDFLQNLTDVVHVQVEKDGSLLLFGIADDATQHIQKLVSRQRSNPKKVEKVRKFNRNYSQVNEARGKPFIPALLRGELLLLLKNFPGGISYSSLVIAYRKTFKKQINLEWLSKNQDEKFQKLAEAVPEIELKTVYGQLKIYRKDIDQNQAKPEQYSASNSLSLQRKEKVSNCSSHNSKENDEKYLYSSVIPDPIKANFSKVLKLYPDGILAIHFPVAYEMIMKEPLDIFALSYTSLLEIADALPDIFFYYKNPNKKNEWVFKHADFRDKVSSTNSKSNGLAHKSIPQKSSVSSHYVEDLDISSHCSPYEKENLPSDGFRNFFPVFVSAISNPGLFWIQVQTQDVTDKFTEHEGKMNCFYDESSHKYKMKDAHIAVGASCVVFSRSDDHWYRSEIISIPSIEYVTVTYVDYGGIEKIEKYNLYYLKNEFKIFPRHSHKATLAGIIPANQLQTWNNDALNFFFELTSRLIMAKITCRDEDVVSLILSDTREGKTIFVNDTLVEEGYAEFYCSNNNTCNGSEELNRNSQGDEVNSLNHVSHNQANGEIETASTQFYCSNNYTCNGSEELDRNSPGDEVNSLNHVSHIQTNGKIETTNTHLRNEEKMLNSLLNGSSLKKQPVFKRRNERYVKRVSLGEGFVIHIIIIDNEAYVSGGDLCNLFWTDKPADVLSLKLKFKRVSIPVTCVSENDNFKLFYQCKRYSVKGFSDAESSSSVELYPLNCVMKILNTFGHPSAKIRETLVEEISNLDLHSSFWKEYQDPERENLEKSVIDDNTWISLCLYDLQALQTGLEYQRLKLMNECNSSDEIEKIASKQRNIRKRMDEISLICSQYGS